MDTLQLRYHVADGLCVSVALSGDGSAGCDTAGCQVHEKSATTSQMCNEEDPFQL